MSLTEFIILALATWRVGSFVTDEDGLWGILSKLRTLAGVEGDDRADPVARNWLAAQLICLWCVTLIIGLAWAIAWLFAPSVAVWCALPFALSAIAIIINGRGIRYRKKEW